MRPAITAESSPDQPWLTNISPDTVTDPLADSFIEPFGEIVPADVAVQQQVTQFVFEGDAEGERPRIHSAIVNHNQVLIRDGKSNKNFVARQLLERLGLCRSRCFSQENFRGSQVGFVSAGDRNRMGAERTWVRPNVDQSDHIRG